MANDLHVFRTGVTNATWAGSGDTDTFRCHFCGVDETVRNGAPAQNVRWVVGNASGVLYACNKCQLELAEKER
jgi:hypothetical protein